MSEADGAARCDWSGCELSAVHELPVRAGMTLTIGERRVTGTTVGMCAEHAPRAAAIFLEAVDEALDRHRARTNFAPGDAEWEATFGRDDEAC